MPESWRDAYTIDRMGAADIEQVVRLELESGLSSRGSEGYLSILQSPNHILLAARTAPGRTPVGIFTGAVIIDELEVDNVAVVHSHRMKGLAGSLLSRGMAEASKLGAARAFLEVRESNFPAINLYRKYGFSVAGRRHRYYSNPVEDALLMSADIE